MAKKKSFKDSYKRKRASMRDSPFSRILDEKKFLGGLIKFPKVVGVIVNQFDSRCLSSDKLKWLYEEIEEFFNKTGYVLDDKGFNEYVGSLKVKKRKIYKRLWKSIKKISKKISEASTLVIKDNLEKLYDARLMIYNANHVADILDKADVDGIDVVEKAKKQYEKINDELSRGRTVIKVVDAINSYDDFKEYHQKAQANPKRYKGVPTGMRPLDKKIGGLRDSESGMVLTRTGVGKSILLMEFAAYCYQFYGDVIYVTIEMPEIQLRQRLYCHLSRIKYKYFRNFDLNKKHWRRLNKKIKSRFENHPFKFNIIDIPGSGTVADIKNRIETILNHNPGVRLICVDYLNIMRCSTGAIAVEWPRQIEIAIDLKQMYRYFDKPGWSAAQLKADTEGKETKIRISDMALSKNIPDHIDIGVTAQDTPEENIFRIGFIKARDFKGEEFYVKGDRDRMTFNTVSKKESEKYYEQEQGGLKV